MMTDARIKSPIRNQVELHSAALDDLVSGDHVVRSLWSMVTKLDLSKFHATIKARDNTPGRDATDPRVLLTLWAFGISEGVSSARYLAELCKRDIFYMWVCGGVPVNHHMLSDFRSQSGELVDDLLTQTIGRAMKAGVVTLERTTQDGMKVRAHAGASSFRREETLARCLEEAKQLVLDLKKELHEDGSTSKERQKKTRLAAAERRQKAIEAALAEMPKVKEQRAKQEKANKQLKGRAEPRVSTTDPDARVMKMADGGFRPALNVQFVADVAGGMIVGVDVSNRGGDVHEVEPAIADLAKRTGLLPKEHLVDGGYVGVANIEALAQSGIIPYAPVPKPRDENVDRYAVRPDDSPEVAEWRQRMATEEAKEIYKQRASTAERVHADLRAHRGLTRVNVKGLTKVTSVILFSALTFNLLRCIALNVA